MVCLATVVRHLLAWLLLHQATAAAADAQAALQRRLSGLSQQFGQFVFPRLSPNQSVTVRFTFVLRQLLQVNCAEQTVSVSAFLAATWQDERMVWDDSKFAGVKDAAVGSGSAWQPQVLVFNGVSGSNLLPAASVRLQHRNRNISTVAADWKQQFRFHCSFSLRWFPADHHRCRLQLQASDVGTIHRIVRTKAAREHVNEWAFYTPNSEWQMQSISCREENVTVEIYKGEPQEVSIFVAEFRIRRHSTYYVVVLLLPLLLLTALQLLTYLVPLESGEKIGCGVTVLLSFTMFLLLIDNIVPKSQDVPVIVYVITASMAVAAASLIFNSVLLRMHHTSSDTQMPVWVKTLVNWIGLVTCAPAVGGTRVTKVAAADGDDATAASDDASCSRWQQAAAVVEKLGFFIHLVLVILLVAAVLFCTLR